jgi:hypothetical protein
MSRDTRRFALAAAAVSVLVALVGLLLVGAAERSGVLVGVGVAFAFQVLVLGLLADVLLPGKLVVVHALGLAGRFAVVGLMAFVLVPRLALPVMPTLLALVATLFATTLLEPVFFKSAQPIGR